MTPAQPDGHCCNCGHAEAVALEDRTCPGCACTELHGVRSVHTIQVDVYVADLEKELSRRVAEALKGPRPPKRTSVGVQIKVEIDDLQRELSRRIAEALGGARKAPAFTMQPTDVWTPVGNDVSEDEYVETFRALNGLPPHIPGTPAALAKALALASGSSLDNFHTLVPAGVLKCWPCRIRGETDVCFRRRWFELLLTVDLGADRLARLAAERSAEIRKPHADAYVAELLAPLRVSTSGLRRALANGAPALPPAESKLLTATEALLAEYDASLAGDPE